MTIDPTGSFSLNIGTAINVRMPATSAPAIASHFEHVSGRGLLLERFAQLIEQPRVLDGNDGLVCEGLDQLDLLVGERLYNRSPDEDHPQDISLPQEWGSERRSVAGNLLVLKIDVFRIGQHVGNMNQFAFKRCPARDFITLHRKLI